MVIPSHNQKTIKSSVDEINAETKKAIDVILPALDKISLIGTHLDDANCIMATISLESAQKDLRKVISMLDDISDLIHAHGDVYNVTLL